MGQYSSTRLLSKQEAVQILGHAASRRIEEGFARLSTQGGRSSNNPSIDLRTFHRYVLDAYPLLVSHIIHNPCHTGSPS